MHRQPLTAHRFTEPTRVAVEATLDVALDLGLDTFEGEQFDYVDAVVAIDVTRDEITIETVRTLDGWKRGKPNAGRGTLTIPRAKVAAIHF